MNTNKRDFKEIMYYSIKLFNSTDKFEEIGNLLLTTKLKNSALSVAIESNIKDISCNEIVEIGEKTYLPISYYGSIIKGSCETKLQGEYKGNHVKVKMESQSGVQKLSMKIIKKISFDNTSAFNIIRAISAGVLDISSFYLVNLKTYSNIKVNIKIEEDEEICLQGYNFLCRSIKLSFENKFPNLFQRFLVQKKSPYLLLKYISGAQVIELKKIEEGKNV